MANHDCPDCNCPRDWHSVFTGHCYGCNKDCPSQKLEDTNALPFELAQDLPNQGGPHAEPRRDSGVVYARFMRDETRLVRVPFAEVRIPISIGGCIPMNQFETTEGLPYFADIWKENPMCTEPENPNLPHWRRPKEEPLKGVKAEPLDGEAREAALRAQARTSMNASRPGRGAFTALMRKLALLYPHLSIYVECVLQERFAKTLVERFGFKPVSHDIRSFYLLR